MAVVYPYCFKAESVKPLLSDDLHRQNDRAKKIRRECGENGIRLNQKTGLSP